jgi:hypothetical protein
VYILLVALDDARVSNGGGPGVEACLAERARLAQEVPTPVERDLELLSSPTIGLARASCGLALLCSCSSAPSCSIVPWICGSSISAS